MIDSRVPAVGSRVVTMCSRRVVAAALAALVLATPGTVAAQAKPSSEATARTARNAADPEADERQPAPVLLGGEPVVWITAGAGPYTPQLRADRITRRLEDAIHDRGLRDPLVTVTEVDGSSEVRAGARLLMIVTSADAAVFGVSRASLAQQYAHDLENALRAERQRYAPAALVRSALYGLLATLAFAATLWLIQRFTGTLRRVVRRQVARRAEALRRTDRDMLWPGRVGRTIDAIVRTMRVALVLLAFDVYLTYVLGLFPWTRAVSVKLLGYLLTPLRAVGAALVGYLPKFVFLLVICAAIYLAIRIVGTFFRLIREGRLVFANFPAEWADPTNKIARVLLIAFGLVVAFPYLPASDSPAFAGVSVFMGVLISLSSSSAISNMIAGIVLTYTGAFRLGDRVRLGEAFGDIAQTSLLATRLRTIKNEEVTIPNSIALASAVTNYTRLANTAGLILHTSVTIGYDAPWRKIHDLLVEAALATPGVRHDPRPFVWQTALNDFYVTYEINAYTGAPRDMIDTYAALHARIQDAFYAAGVEIMSPHYTSIRDGNAVAIPPALRPPEYQAPAFRVEDTAALRHDTGVPPRA